MQTHLYLRDYPRALALRPTVLHEAPSSVLVFEQHTTSDRAVAKLVPQPEFDNDRSWRMLGEKPVFGCLGMISVMGECFVAIVTDCRPIGKIRAGEIVYKILSVQFYSLSSSKYDDVDVYNGDYGDNEYDQPPVHPCAQLQKLFSVGNFYFTPDFDLTKTVQARTADASLGIHAFDDHFLWNKFLIAGLLEFRAKLERKKQSDLDRGGFLVLAIRGYVGVETVRLGKDLYELSVISKLSCKRAGTRFNSRGIDDNGHVANFVETETVLYSEHMCYAFTQVRGSVPVFWEHQGIVNQKLQIARGASATQPAVKRHFTELLNRYESVCNINLLSERENTSESSLGRAYNTAVQQLGLPQEKLSMINFDLHAECRGGNYENLTFLLNSARRYLDDHGYFLMDVAENQIIDKQHGVFRTNCMDCLDRTNLVQNEISRMALTTYLRNRFQNNWSVIMDNLIGRHSHLWAENGDGLSRIYAGTGALKSAFTRTGKVTFMNVLSDATRSANRFIINNFQDKAKQEVIDQLLGKLVGQQEIVIHDPISDSVSKLMVKRIKEYSSRRKVTIFCGTYNLNGKDFKGEPLDSWLLQHSRWNDDEPDIYAVGFQEIVELSPQQVMTTDAEKRRVWEEQIEQALNSRSDTKSKYTLLRSNQLVGAALIIFVKTSITEHIRNVETSIKKTGIMGIAGNKGAVAIRMDYQDTSFCFISAHFASGHTNVEERNANFHTINDELRFLRGRTISNHDNIIWMSDFNYRINLSNEQVRAYAAQNNIDALYQADQLQTEMRLGRVFKGYQEGPVTFLPTYKYDVGTQLYDTSEKARIPGWTDRIVFKGTDLKLLQYTRAELLTSDHRPVLAIFEADIVTLDHAAKAKLQKELYQQSLDNIIVDVSPPQQPPQLPQRKIPASQPTVPAIIEKTPLLIDVSLDEEPKTTLPPPSTNSQKWWENGEPLPRADKNRASSVNPFDTKNSNGALNGNGTLQWTPIQPKPTSNGSVKSVKTPSAATITVPEATTTDEQSNEEKSNISQAFGFWNSKQATAS